MFIFPQTISPNRCISLVGRQEKNTELYPLEHPFWIKGKPKKGLSWNTRYCTRFAAVVSQTVSWTKKNVNKNHTFCIDADTESWKLLRYDRCRNLCGNTLALFSFQYVACFCHVRKTRGRTWVASLLMRTIDHVINWTKKIILKNIKTRSLSDNANSGATYGRDPN